MPEDASTLGCYDCGLPYGGEAWCDVVIPDQAWLAISPTGHEGGVLCFNCMARRLMAAHLASVPMMVTSGPFERDPRDIAGTWSGGVSSVAEAPPSQGRPEPLTPEQAKEFEAALDKAGLLQSEYPDQMAQRSCTCEPEAICGAHRLLIRYHELYEALCEANRKKRELRAERDAATTELAALMASPAEVGGGGGGDQPGNSTVNPTPAPNPEAAGTPQPQLCQSCGARHCSDDDNTLCGSFRPAPAGTPQEDDRG